MYTIRADSAQHLLRIEMSGRVTTGEALRALSQSMALADASGIPAVSCDLSEVERGPGGLLMLAAVFSSRYHHPMRVAFVGNPGQARMVQRFMNFTGRAHAMGFFTAAENPERWLAEAPVQRRPAPRLSATARRHARTLLGLQQTEEAQATTREEPAA